MKLGALAAMLAMVGTPVAGMAGNHSVVNRTSNKDAIKAENKPGFSVSKRMEASGSIWRSTPPNFCGNQRQYRRKCRQSPSRYSSSKHRSKN
jgi:hypothetical protein